LACFFDFTAYFSNSHEMGHNQNRNHDPNAHLVLTINADGTSIDGEADLQTSIRFSPSSSSELVTMAPSPPALDTTSDIFPLTSILTFGPDALDLCSRPRSRSHPHSCPAVFGQTPEPLWFANSPSVPPLGVDGCFNSGFDVDQEYAGFRVEFGVEDIDVEDDEELTFFGKMDDL
jgi:hypothetical protein